MCDERLQFCNHITGQCTQWRGLLVDFEDLVSALGDPIVKEDMDGADDMFVSIAIVLGSINLSYISSSIQGHSHAALQAIKYYKTGTQLRLDPEQWKVERRYWFKMAHARVQLEMFNTIERPADVDPERSQNLWAD